MKSLHMYVRKVDYESFPEAVIVEGISHFIGRRVRFKATLVPGASKLHELIIASPLPTGIEPSIRRTIEREVVDRYSNQISIIKAGVEVALLER